MSLFSELKRRNVFRAGIAYVLLGWLLLQITDVVVPILELPGWVAKLVLFLLLLGLPLALFFAWAYELTPEGIKREREVERSESITRQTGRKLDRAIIVVLSIALVWFAWDRFRPVQTDAPDPVAAERETTIADVRRLTAKPVLAVLPFLATGSEDGGFLAAGLHDDLLTRLAKLGAYQVISRTSMMEYADRNKNMRQIGEELGADYVLEGGVQARESRVHINAQLIYAPDDEHLWADTYDRELTAVDLFDVQAELARSIAEAIDTTLSPEDQAVVDDVPTESLEAYNAYLRGLTSWEFAGGVGGKEDRDAIAALEEAVRLDPEFAQAWAWLAAAYIKSSGNQFDSEASEAALTAIANARELQPDLLETELAWAEYQYRQMQEYAEALETLEGLGERIAGNVYALSLKAYLNRRLGRYDEGYRILQSAWRLEPRSPGIYFDLIVFSVLTDDCDAAHRHAEMLSSLAPENSVARGHVALYELECNGDARRAADLLRGRGWVMVGDVPVALVAAFSARDAAMVLEVIADLPSFASGPEVLIWQQLSYYDAYTYLIHDTAQAGQALDRAGALLEAYGADPELARGMGYSVLQRDYHAALGDVAETMYWVEEHRRRRDRETKGDVHSAAVNRFLEARDLARAGLYDEAVEKLRIMLEEGGGYRFPFVDGLPVFDGLRDHPGYVALRERFGS